MKWKAPSYVSKSHIYHELSLCLGQAIVEIVKIIAGAYKIIPSCSGVSICQYFQLKCLIEDIQAHQPGSEQLNSKTKSLFISQDVSCGCSDLEKSLL